MSENVGVKASRGSQVRGGAWLARFEKCLYKPLNSLSTGSRKMTGVSPNASHLAPSGKSKSVEELKGPNTSSLVKTPASLPSSPSRPSNLFNSCLSWALKIFNRPFNSKQTGPPKCPNLPEIAITISDSPQKAKRDDIQTLAISTTLAKIPENLESVSKPSSCQLSHLKCLDITIEGSRAPCDSHGANLATDVIVDTIRNAGSTLTDLKISSTATEDDCTNLSPLFQHLGSLPSLSAFTVTLGTQTLASDGGEGLTAFLNANKPHLQHLVLQPYLHPGETPPGFDFPKLREWLADEFTRLKFPKLRTLEIDFSREARDPMRILRYFRKLEHVMPSLTSLTLSHAVLSLDDLDFVLEMAAGTELKSLRCSVKPFSPRIQQLLVTKAPHLTSSDLTYEETVLRPCSTSSSSE